MTELRFIRSEDAERLPPPANVAGARGWLRANLFADPFNIALSLVFGAVALWLFWRVCDFAIVNAVWHGATRQDCLVRPEGACWPMVHEKMGQWIYGFYPIDQRWRVNLCFVLFAVGAVPMLAPSLPHKLPNAAYLFIVFPLVTVVLLTGGNVDLTAWSYLKLVCLISLASVALPILAFGLEEGLRLNYMGVVAGGLAVVLWLLSFFVPEHIYSPAFPVSMWAIGVGFLSIVTGALSCLAVITDGRGGRSIIVGATGALAASVAAFAILDCDFGLVPVDTAQWGGLLVTLIVSVTGIVASLPLGIVLALGRRSDMPLVSGACTTFIEVVRGVPLITVLFMSSVMLPLFLPPGVSFDKLLRALIGVALFSSAYMAEVIRGGLQGVGKGQYEGSVALGLTYWPMMLKVVLPQALKISIPNIVSNFISLFKDTTLVLIIGLFDLLGIVQTTLRDPNWATPASAATGYLAVAAIYWVFCFGMSRYSAFTERRLNRAHPR